MCRECEEGEYMKKKLLITGFEPFGGEKINPSWEAVKRLSDEIGDFELIKLQIPTLFGGAGAAVLKRADEIRPDVILCVGQAGGRSMITPELAAINMRDASIADNGGYKPWNEPVVAGGPDAYFTSLPVRQMVAAVKESGIPCALSYSAGVYVCNDLFYTLRHHYEGTKIRVGFIHVPYLPEQAENAMKADEAGGRVSSMLLELIVQGLEAAVKAISDC